MIFVVKVYNSIDDTTVFNRAYVSEDKAKAYCEKMNKSYGESSDTGHYMTFTYFKVVLFE